MVGLSKCGDGGSRVLANQVMRKGLAGKGGRARKMGDVAVGL